MIKLDFYKEGTTLFYVKKDIEESFLFNILLFSISFFLVTIAIEITDNDWIGRIIKNLFIVLLVLLSLKVLYNIFTENDRPYNSKYYITVINSKLYYEKITPKKEGFNSNNQLNNFEIIKFIDEKRDVIKIISNNNLPWRNRKVYISKEYLPFKIQVIDYLNENYTV